jgi:hypothetical protein
VLLRCHPNTLKRIKPEDLPYFTLNERGDRRYLADDVARFVARRMVTRNKAVLTWRP